MDLRHRCACDHQACEVRLETLVGAVLHLACSENAWMCSVCLEVSTACFRERGGVSGNSTATRPGVNQAGREVCGTSGNATSVPGTTGMSSSVRTPSPLLRNPRAFYLHVSCTSVSMPCQRVREKGKSCVILPHAVHIHLAVPATLDALLVSVLRCRWWSGRGVVPRCVTPLRDEVSGRPDWTNSMSTAIQHMSVKSPFA